jgi:HlyD family secretion protein
MDATVTWDALPGRQWRGTVEKTPTQIVPLGTRQVGEVLCQIDNADSVLLPGTNVNVSLRSSLAENAVSLPKEAIQRRNQESGVYVINGGRLAWRPVRTGVASITRVEISEGLREGDSVAVPGAVPLAEGMAVRAAKP